MEENSPKRHDLILNDIWLHGNKLTHPKNWYSETIRASSVPEAKRVYTNSSRVFETEDGRTGIEIEFPLSKDVADILNTELKNGSMPKIQVRKEGIHICNTQTMIEKIRAGNKRLGFEYYEDLGECRALPFGPIELKSQSVKMRVVLI